MKSIKSKPINNQRNLNGHGQYEQHQRCELCNVPIFHNPCCDVRSSGDLKGKGKVLCNKCAAILVKIPTEQAIQALDNASKTYAKE